MTFNRMWAGVGAGVVGLALVGGIGVSAAMQQGQPPGQPPAQPAQPAQPGQPAASAGAAAPQGGPVTPALIGELRKGLMATPG